MVSALKQLLHRESAARWVEYLVKAIVLFALFGLIAWLAPMMPPLCLAIIWAVLSAVSAIGVAYHYVITKARKRYGLREGGASARFNSGRIITLTIAFVVSAICVGGLILELPKWELADWIVLVLAIPLYIGIYLAMHKALANQYTLDCLWTSRTVMASSAILCVVLLLVYVLICFLGPVAHFETMTEAFLGAKQPFEGSSSVLLEDFGYVTALIDGLTAFAMTMVSEDSLAVYVVWRVVLFFSTAAGISSLIGACSLKLTELKLVFQPLDAVDDPENDHPIMKRYVVMACVLPIILVACSAAVDMKVSEMAKTDGYTMVKHAVREQVGMAACVIDGKRYDYERVKELFDKAREASKNLAEERERVLTPIINEQFDKRIENVDAYLDWYYSLPADYERLVQFFTGTIESSMREQLEAKINEGIDETQLDEQLEYYLQKSEELVSLTEQELGQYELTENYGLDDIPEWLIKPVVTLSTDDVYEPLAPTHHFLDASERMGLSAGIGVISGIIAAKVAGRIAEKAFFKKIVAEVTEKLAIRGLLAEGGTLIVPGLGTALGIGVGFAADYLFLKADEAQNRESYKEEIVTALEECRQDMLDLVSAPEPATS